MINNVCIQTLSTQNKNHIVTTRHMPKQLQKKNNKKKRYNKKMDIKNYGKKTIINKISNLLRIEDNDYQIVGIDKNNSIYKQLVSERFTK